MALMSQSSVLGNTFLQLKARRVRPHGDAQVLLRLRLTSFHERAEDLLSFPETTPFPETIFFYFHLAQLPLLQSLPRIVSTALRRLDTTTQQLCEPRMLRFTSEAAAAMQQQHPTTRTMLELLVDVSVLHARELSPNDIADMVSSLRAMPLEREEDDTADSVRHYYFDSTGLLRRGERGVRVGRAPASSSSIMKVERSTYVQEDGFQEECAICLEEFEVGRGVSRLPCSHAFHSRCFDQWLMRSHRCPLCRRPCEEQA
ncbi:E3 ubiquitin-protein ligase DZIP3-like [Phoenix dactylifera]|uniref:E3 ubiquitin-protein ligase DZIP3-like n=1 Tax=Phoenix dactylifera TaxID=42345 RepID=A0A8B7MUZ4_PHODC|nr:E3 ubiquitin-protein ligase DZIP3-like [Phoenix dactylifera]